MFAGDGHVSPEDWLQSVNGYRTSLDLTDAQILLELPRFWRKSQRNGSRSLTHTLLHGPGSVTSSRKFFFLPTDRNK